MKKAVAYIRVSTKSDAQLHSYDYQLDYWKNEINDKTDYEFIGLYADWGISGRSLSKRTQFLKMIEDAKKKEFDVIFTKSVSRFGRNTTELLETVRLLRDIGIKVIFEKEQIDSFNPSAEIYLTVAASVAENDLKIYSENVKWSLKRRFKKGYILIGQGLYGYKLDAKTNSLTINEEQAQVIRTIFELYKNGKGFELVARTLNEMKIPGPKGNLWTVGALKYIISNEKYKGCNLSQKTITVNGESKLNRGEERMYYSENSHPAIIDPKLFDEVQQIRKERACQDQIGKYGPKELYPFTKKIKCGICGCNYNHKINNTNKAWRTEIWVCSERSRHASTKCNNKNIKDSVLKEKFIEAYNEFIVNSPKSVEELKIKNEMKELLQQENELKLMKVNDLIEEDDYERETNSIRDKIKKLSLKLTDSAIRDIQTEDYNQISSFVETKVDKFIDMVIIKNNEITFKFYNGVEITKIFSNGPSGNKKGWKERRK